MRIHSMQLEFQFRTGLHSKMVRHISCFFSYGNGRHTSLPIMSPAYLCLTRKQDDSFGPVMTAPSRQSLLHGGRQKQRHGTEAPCLDTNCQPKLPNAYCRGELVEVAAP